MHARSARRTALVATVLAIGLFATQAARADAIITAGDNTINYTGTIVNYTIQTAGIYDITATGANGGSSYYTGYPGEPSPGNGITLGGDVFLAANQGLEVAVGGGGTGPDEGGGGGGSFVVLSANATPLVIGGGGGGAGYHGSGTDAMIGTNAGPGVGGSGGNGGSGGGFSQSGADGTGGYAGFGGAGFAEGLRGGDSSYSYAGAGGFGGGGGAGAYGAGGGGGGYDGGSGGSGSGGGFGGTSYLAPYIANLVLPSTFNAGGAGANGFITINFVTGVTSVPEPGSLALLATGLLGLGALTRRRKSL